MKIGSILKKFISVKKNSEYVDGHSSTSQIIDDIDYNQEKIINGIDQLSNEIAYFKKGVLYTVRPRNHAVSLYDDRQVAYNANTVIISDNDVYDPAKPESIDNLHIPRFPHICDNVVFDLSCILKMRCSMIDNPDVIPQFVSKTLEMMQASPIAWSRRDYLRVICNYYCNGLFEDGDRFEKHYRDSHVELFSNPYDAIYEAEHLSSKYYFEDKWRRYQEYKELKALFPNKVPNTAKGYFQIRTRQTKRFLEIKDAAEEKGYMFSAKKSCHYYKKMNTYIRYSKEYNRSGRYPILISVQCEFYTQGFCNGVDNFGLFCVYPHK